MPVSMRSLGAAVAAAAVFGVAGCASAGSDSAAPSASVRAELESTSPETVEEVLVPTASGGQLDFNSLRGQDVVLWFWAPW